MCMYHPTAALSGVIHGYAQAPHLDQHLLQYADLAQPERRTSCELVGTLNVWVPINTPINQSNELHLLFVNLQISVWFEWVPTKCNIPDIPRRPQGSEEYEFYEREGFTRWSGDMVFPSAKSVASHDLDLLKWRPREDTQSTKDAHEYGSWIVCFRTTVQPNPTMSPKHLCPGDAFLVIAGAKTLHLILLQR
jgi:hypothetical protein